MTRLDRVTKKYRMVPERQATIYVRNMDDILAAEKIVDRFKLTLLILAGLGALVIGFLTPVGFSVPFGITMASLAGVFFGVKYLARGLKLVSHARTVQAEAKKYGVLDV